MLTMLRLKLMLVTFLPPCLLSMMFLSVAMVPEIVNAPALRGPCPYGYFKIKGDSTCRLCPRCPRGWGSKCSWMKIYPPDDIPKCTECEEGKTYNDQDNSTLPCRFCLPLPLPPDHVETRSCTKTHNREAGCKRGFYADEPRHDCGHQCCYCHGTAKKIKKCVKDGLADGRFCAPTRPDKKCDIIVPPTTAIPTTTTTTTTTTATSETRTTRPSTTTSSTTSSPTSTLTTKESRFSTVSGPSTATTATTATTTTTTVAPTMSTTTTTAVISPTPVSNDTSLMKIGLIGLLVLGSLAIFAVIVRCLCRPRGEDPPMLLSNCGVFFRRRYGSVATGEEPVALPVNRKEPEYVEIAEQNQHLRRGSQEYISSNHTSIEYLLEGTTNRSPPSTTNGSARNSGVNDGPELPPRNASRAGTGTTTPSRSRSQTPVHHFQSTNTTPAGSRGVSPSRQRELTPERRSRKMTPNQDSLTTDLTDCSCPTKLYSQKHPNPPQDHQPQQSQHQKRTHKGKGVLVSRTRRRHRIQLAGILDLRGENVEKNWYHLGKFLVGDDKKAQVQVDRCHESYYGGYEATKAMLIDLESSQPFLPLSSFVKICEGLGRKDVLDYLDSHDFKTERFFELPEEHRATIITILERRKEAGTGNYWKDFADTFGFSVEEINKFQEYKKRPQKYSPTEELIEVLIHWKSDITIEDLQIATIAIDRPDAYDCLDFIAEDLLKDVEQERGL